MQITLNIADEDWGKIVKLVATALAGCPPLMTSNITPASIYARAAVLGIDAALAEAQTLGIMVDRASEAMMADLKAVTAGEAPVPTLSTVPPETDDDGL